MKGWFNMIKEREQKVIDKNTKGLVNLISVFFAVQRKQEIQLIHQDFINLFYMMLKK